MAAIQPSGRAIPLPWTGSSEAFHTASERVPSQRSNNRTTKRRQSEIGIAAGLVFIIFIVVIKFVKISKKSTTDTYSFPTFTYKPNPYPPTSNPTRENNFPTTLFTQNSFLRNPASSMNESCDLHVCESIVDDILNSINESVDPCENFYDFACKGWQEYNPRPDYMPEWSVFSKLRSENTKRVIRILEAPSKITSEQTPLDSAKLFYKKCVSIDNTNEIEDKAAIQLMWNILEKQGGWPILYKKGTWNKVRLDWISSIVALRRQFQTPSLLDVSSYQYPYWRKNTNTIFIRPPSPSSSSIGTIDKFLDSKNIFKGIKSLQNLQNLIVNISKVFLEFKGKTGVDDAYLNDQASNALLVQILLPSPGEPPQYKLSSYDKLSLGMEINSNTANTSLSNIQVLLDKSMFPFVNDLKLPKLLQALYKNTNVRIHEDEPVVISDVPYLLNLAKFITETKEEALANYLSFRMTLSMIPLSGHRKLMNLLRDFENGLSGTEGKQERKEICADTTQEKFHVAVGYEFVQTEYKTNELEFQQARITFENLKVSVQKLLQSSNKPYLNKNMLIFETAITSLCLGYPSWMNVENETKIESEYKGLQLKDSVTFLEQNMALNSWAVDKSFTLLRTQLSIEDDDCQWTKSPGYVGAYNVIADYSVYLPVGIMQQPFYNLFMPLALVYGKLGSILGHEIIHGLAGPGWSELPNGGLTPSGKCLVNQYSNFSTPTLRKENVTLNGEKTLVENIPDNAGLMGAYNAFKGSVDLDGETRRLEALHNFTDDQLFFLGFAQLWCETNTPIALRKSMKNDDHPPGMFRVLGSLQNSKEFAAAWKCSLGSKMNPFPVDNQKCSIF